MPQIQLLDGKKIPFTKSITGLDLTKKISKSLEKSALIMEVDGQLKDLSYEIKKDSKVRIITSKDKEGLDVIRHDAAHIMAMAVQNYIWNSSYYWTNYRKWILLRLCKKDPFTKDDLKKIEKKMSEIIDKDVDKKVWKELML